MAYPDFPGQGQRGSNKRRTWRGTGTHKCGRPRPGSAAGPGAGPPVTALQLHKRTCFNSIKRSVASRMKTLRQEPSTALEHVRCTHASVCGPMSHTVQSTRGPLVQVTGVETEALRTGFFLPEVAECVAGLSFGSSSLAWASCFSRGDPTHTTLPASLRPLGTPQSLAPTAPDVFR